MDINSLLSPSDSPVATPTPQPSLPSPSVRKSPRKRVARQMPSRTPSGLSQQITSSPQPHAALQTIPSPSLVHLTESARAIHSALSTPRSIGSPHDARLASPHPLYRHVSASSMDTLADLATIQQQQVGRQASIIPQRPVTLQHLGQHLSGESIASIMSDSTPTPRPRTFVTKSLDQEHIEWLQQLDASLLENPFDYYSHVSLVTTLHQGFQNHLASVESDAHSYELMHTLRDAYRAMSDKYALGETLWHYRLNDEKTLARDVEGRMGVLELYKQATQEEPYSAKLWAAYGEYISHLIACSRDLQPPEEWTEEERQIGSELFSPQLLVDTLQLGAEKVKFNLQESNLVWDRYLQVLEEDLEKGGLSKEKAARISAVFNERLSQPHATWSNTLSRFASFISRYNLGHPEDIMDQARAKNLHIIQQYANREDYEFKVLQALQAGDQAAEHSAITRYLKWEKKTLGVHSIPIVNALYERATLRFPVDPSLWEDHIEFLIWRQDRSIDVLDVLERATRHCPWSGSLWSYRILTLEAEDRAFEDVEHVKHTATGSGLLEHADLEELVKVQIAWCGYLRRKAFDDPRATEDDIDVAEVGIRSALEFVREVGMKKHGREWADPKYRLERIHMKFWLQRDNVEEARNIWNSLIKQQADSYDFWYRWYIFEMVYWSQDAIRSDRHAGKQLKTPVRATAVLEGGMERLHTIDQPESLVEMYANHCEQHESVLKVRSAAIERRRAERVVAIRREKEKADAEAEAAQQKQSVQIHTMDGVGKRKREGEIDGDSSTKKSRHTQSEADTAYSMEGANGHARIQSEAPSEARSIGAKRDREHTTIFVRKLPQGTPPTRIRQFFSDAGKVRNVTLKEEKDSLMAIVEFETQEEAEYALSKEAKGFETHNISIERGQSTTLYVANYPAHADEAYIRELFAPFGEIIAIRFPSLKFDTHRRFCYVQYGTADDAVAATELDGSDAEGLKIIAKISNPQAKKKRDGATAEGREVYIRSLNFKIRQSEVEEAFSSFGRIDRVNMPLVKATGSNKGFCYIVYEVKEAANAAVAEMNGKDFWGLSLQVVIASDRANTKPKFRSTLENADSPKSREATPGHPNTASNADKKTGTVTERSLAILNLPDTIPDTRVKPLVEPYDFKKITLEPQHGGAIIEFTTIEGAGKAEIALQGINFEGRTLQIGTPAQLKKQKGEWKASNNFIQPVRVNRPTAAPRGGMRARGKPGLGFGSRSAAPSTTNASNVSNGEAKSNADFRAMLLKQSVKTNETSNGDEMEE